jgi:hypothetical protein
MTTRRCFLSGLAIGVVVLGGHPHRLSAQEPSPAPAQSLRGVRTIAAARNADADTLESRATVALRRRDGWWDAARLQRRAAERRGDDPRAVESYARAAWMYSGAGRLGTARQMMERAAERAAMGGDVERAAGSYLDAALIAVEAKREDLVPGLVARARRLIDSPILPAAQRASLLQRIERAPVLARHAPSAP